MMSGQPGDTFNRDCASTPAVSSSPSSLISADIDSTTPWPIKHSTLSRKMPEGIR